MRVLLLLSALLLPFAIHAAEPTQARALFKTLSETAHEGNLAKAGERLQQLKHYPLYPYLIATNLQARLAHNPTRKLDAQIAAFIDAHPHLPPVLDLRHAWLQSLGERQRWAPLRERVDASDGTALQCWATTAAIKTQASTYEQIVERGLEFWHRGYSQPASCNPVFEWLEHNDELTEARIIERIRLAVLAGRNGLAQYLVEELPADTPPKVDRWLNVSLDPDNLYHVSQLRSAIAVQAFKQSARTDLDRAANAISKLDERLKLDAQAVYQMRRYVSLLYAQNHRPDKALEWFAKLEADRMDDFARSWETRAAILKQDWQAVLAAIEAMPNAQAADGEWRYWQGRALAALGKNKAAHKIWKQLAQKRSYHGYMAADQLGLSYQLDPDPLTVNQPVLTDVAAMPNIRRAHELQALGRHEQAQREWLWGINDLSTKGLRQAALLARKWDWHSMSIITLARSAYWDDLRIRYPLHYREEAAQAAQRSHLTTAYVLSIMRTESLFMPSARSSAGAIGLMQLMPATARHVAMNLPVPEPSHAMLKTPSVNIRLGAHYLHTMLNRFRGHLALATAAYNAGPNAIARWILDRSVPADIWIANIPYTQTRRYVQRVLKHMIAFQARMDKDIIRLENRLYTIPPAAKFAL